MKSKEKLEKEFLEADKLWKIWKIALTDLRIAERSKYCQIDMSCWVRKKSKRSRHCIVCAAGSVLLRRFDISGEYTCPSDFPDCIDRKMQAINLLRTGSIGSALRVAEFFNCIVGHYEEFWVEDYHSSKRAFWRDAKNLLNYLKENDI